MTDFSQSPCSDVSVDCIGPAFSNLFNGYYYSRLSANKVIRDSFAYLNCLSVFVCCFLEICGVMLPLLATEFYQ